MRLKEVFNRAFNSHDVARLGEVYFLNKCRHGGGFTRARWTADQDQPVGVAGQFLEVRVQVQLFYRGLKRCEQPDGHANASRSLQYIDSASDALNVFGQVIRTTLKEARPGIHANNLLGSLQQILARNGSSKRAQCTSNAYGRRQGRFQMQIARSVRLGRRN